MRPAFVLLRRFGTRLFASRAGGVAVVFALALPIVAVACCGAMDVAWVVSGRGYLQGVADAAALQGATQLTFDQSNATNQRTIDFATSQAAALGGAWTSTVSAQSDPVTGSMTVAIKGGYTSIFGNFINPKFWTVDVSSTALANARRPLCVLGTDQKGDTIHIGGQSSVLSPDCMIQSDGNIKVDNGAFIAAGSAAAVNSASGSITPSAITNAPSVPDPFSNLAIDIPTTCTDTDKLQYSVGVQTLNPGVHCGTVNLSGAAVLMLNPGEHYFIKGNFHLTGAAQLLGTDVVLIFRAHYDLAFDQDSSMSLAGRLTGPYAGFVMVTARNYSGNFQISTSHARVLLGTIYLPSTTLQISGTNNAVADQSPWTVVVAKQVQATGSARLVVNANYAATSVPVPTGVGKSAASVTLVK